MKQLIISLTTLATASLLVASPVFAGSGTYGTTTTICQPTYGGSTCKNVNLIIDKKVADPSTQTKGGTVTFKDNLGVNDAKYGAGQTVTFQIIVTNTSDTELSNIAVKDVLPQYLTSPKINGWNYDSNSRTLSTTIPSLKPNESKTFTLTAAVVGVDQLPSGQDVSCVVNQSFASVANVNVQDNAQFCIQKSVVPTPTMPVYPVPPVKTTPKTGPELLALFGLIPSGLGGLILRKRAISN